MTNWRKRRPRHAILPVLTLAYSLSLTAGCGRGWRALPELEVPSYSRKWQDFSLTADGRIALAGGPTIELAGVVMRTGLGQNGGTDLRLIGAILRKQSAQVAVQLVGPKRRAIAYYRQLIEHDSPAYASGWWLFMPDSEWVTVNEVLIAWGLAFCDETDKSIPPAEAVRLQRAQRDYAWVVLYKPDLSIHRLDLIKYPRTLYFAGARMEPRLASVDRTPEMQEFWRTKCAGYWLLEKNYPTFLTVENTATDASTSAASKPAQQ